MAAGLRGGRLPHPARSVRLEALVDPGRPGDAEPSPLPGRDRPAGGGRGPSAARAKQLEHRRVRAGRRPAGEADDRRPQAPDPARVLQRTFPERAVLSGEDRVHRPGAASLPLLTQRWRDHRMAVAATIDRTLLAATSRGRYFPG